MDLTQEEKDRGILILTDMTLSDFYKVIDAKIAELDEKVAKYVAASADDIRNWKHCTPHELNVLVDIHKTYAESTRKGLQELKTIATKNLNKDYMVPGIIVETFVDLARKVSTIHYIKLPASYSRVS